jgi:peptidoglycan/xylan/chitin deacetylase (PgdA/CDA1 family)
MLHRVLNDLEFNLTNCQSGITLRSETFRSLANYAAGHFEAVPLTRGLFDKEGKGPRLAFTFDDGWSDNFTVAAPIARATGIPLTIFVCTGLTGARSPFWPERVLSGMKASQPQPGAAEIESVIENLKLCSKPVREHAVAVLTESDPPTPNDPGIDSTLSWKQVKELERAGVSIGSHTVTHQLLTTVPLDEALTEIMDSKIELDSRLAKPCVLFSYPNGNYSSEMPALLKACGYELAFTTQCGAWTAISDSYAIPRINISDENVVGPTGRFSPSLFEYAVFWKTWRAMRSDAASQWGRRS